MMCEHEFVEASATFLTGTVFRRVCRYCTKTPREIELEQQLAAAQAELAAEREKATTDTFAGQTWVTFSEHMKALNKIKQMEDAIKFDFERFMDFQRRAEQAEAQCAAMQTAINRYVFGNIELLDALKAALEEKP